MNILVIDGGPARSAIFYEAVEALAQDYGVPVEDLIEAVEKLDRILNPPRLDLEALVEQLARHEIKNNLFLAKPCTNKNSMYICTTLTAKDKRHVNPSYRPDHLHRNLRRFKGRYRKP